MTELVKEMSREMDALHDVATNLKSYQRAVEIIAGIKNLKAQIDEFETEFKSPAYLPGALRHDVGTTTRATTSHTAPRQVRVQADLPRKTSFASIEVKIAF